MRDVHRVIDEHILPEGLYDVRGARSFRSDACVFIAFYFEAANRLTSEERQRAIALASRHSPGEKSTKIVRDGSLLNQVALIRLDPAQLSPDTRAEAAGGIVAYSAVCTHEGCPISMWHKDSKTLFCACHASRFDPADRARVVDGPAPRRLAMLPLGPIGGGIVAAGGFTGRVGRQTA